MSQFDVLSCHVPITYLDGLPVDFGPDFQILGILDDIARDDSWTKGRPAVKGLAERPLASSVLELPVSVRHIVANGVSQHIIEGVGLGHICASLANHHNKLTFVVQAGSLLRHRVDRNGVNRAGERCDGLVE